jgi:hypothetical protein
MTLYDKTGSQNAAGTVLPANDWPQKHPREGTTPAQWGKLSEQICDSSGVANQALISGTATATATAAAATASATATATGHCYRYVENHLARMASAPNFEPTKPISMKHLLLTTLLVFATTFTFGQGTPAGKHLGDNAKEDVRMEPRHRVLPEAPSVDHQRADRQLRAQLQETKKGLKPGLGSFLANRAMKKLERALPVTVAKGLKDNGHSLLYILLVVILILLIITLLDFFIPSSLWYIFVLLLLIVLVLWLLGWI